MAVRRVMITEQRAEGRPVVTFSGMPREEGESELYAPYGFASGRMGGGLLIEIQDDPDNHVTLAPRGDRIAPEATLVYWRETEIELRDDQIELRLGDSFFRIKDGKVMTNLTIETTGDVIASGVSLKDHIHRSVMPGSGVSGKPL